MKYGVCVCGNWGEAPEGFSEKEHFLKCPCGRMMYLHQSKPISYPEEKFVKPIIVRQGE